MWGVSFVMGSKNIAFSRPSISRFLLISIWLSSLFLVPDNRFFFWCVSYFGAFLIYFDFSCPHFSPLRETKKGNKNN